MRLESKKDIVKKLLRDELNEAEQDQLLYSRPVTERMQRQWEEAPDRTKSDKVDGKRIWNKIQQETWLRLPAKTVRFYQIYAWTATVALLLGLAGSIFFITDNAETSSVYIVSSGIQNMQSVILSDGTVVKLGPGSKLTYPSKFVGKNREITLDGQAFFDINKDPAHPFIVHTNSMDVEALGTAFELFAYDIETRSEVILLNGMVRVELILPNSDKRKDLILRPNDKIEYNMSVNRVTHYTVNADSYTSWRKRGMLTFENEKLSMIIPRLEQWYGRKIICEKEILDTYKFTFKVKDEPLERILYMMRESSPVRYLQSDDGDFTFYLKK